MTEYQALAHKDLSQYKALTYQINTIKHKIDRLQDDLTRCTTATDSGVKPHYRKDGTLEMVQVITANRVPGRPKDELIALKVDLFNDFTADQISLIALCEQLEMRIKRWTEPLACEIISRYYLFGLTHEEIVKDLQKTRFAYSLASIKRFKYEGLEAYGRQLASLSHFEPGNYDII